MVPYVWEFASHDDAGARRLAEAVRVDPMVGRLLWQRGLTDPEAAHRFLYPTLAHRHDPLRLADMSRAVDRLLAAVARGERIAVHGDYDVDGITATFLLSAVLQEMGGRVEVRIPHRVRDGYGLSVEAMEDAHRRGCGLVVTVDCGVTAVEAVERDQVGATGQPPFYRRANHRAAGPDHLCRRSGSARATQFD